MKLCEYRQSFPSGYFCENGAWYSCAQVAVDSECYHCGCSQAGDICQYDLDTHEFFCAPPLAPGESCDQYWGEYCASEICTEIQGAWKCSVPLGSPCDETNCNDCFGFGDTTFCTAGCGDIYCPSGWGCVDRTDGGVECWPKCSDSSTCPNGTQCEDIASSNGWDIAFRACLPL
jgi:hypothetical protein